MGTDQLSGGGTLAETLTDGNKSLGTDIKHTLPDGTVQTSIEDASGGGVVALIGPGKVTSDGSLYIDATGGDEVHLQRAGSDFLAATFIGLNIYDDLNMQANHISNIQDIRLNNQTSGFLGNNGQMGIESGQFKYQDYSGTVHSLDRIDKSYTSTGSSYAIQEFDRIIGVETNSGAVTLTILDSAEYTGHILEVKDIDGNASGNNITLSFSIDGSASKTISTDYGKMILIYDGTTAQWYEL